jgi:outer membrane protein TolC
MKGVIFFICCFWVTACLQAQEKTLDYYINAALQSSPLLSDYINQQKQNSIDSARIAAGYKPQVNGVSTNSYAPVIHGYGYDGAITNYGTFSQLITASKQLVSKANLNNQYASIKLLNDSVHIASKITEQDLKKTVTSQYITAFGSWQQYEFNNEIYQLLVKEDTVLKKLTQASVYRQTDYLTFLVALQQQRVAVITAHNQYQNDFAGLNYVSGLFDTSFTQLSSPSLQLDSILDAQNTVFYDKFRTDSLLLKNADAQIDFNYKPKINLYADAGYLTSFTYDAYKNFGTSVGVNLIVPIYDGKQRKMQHTKIAIAEDTRKKYQEFFINQYNQQLAQLYQQLQNTRMLINETTGQLKYVQGLINANSKLLSTGDVRMADYVIAINNYLNAKNTIVQNTIASYQVIAQINYWNRK